MAQLTALVDGIKSYRRRCASGAVCHSKACTSSLEHFVNDCGNSMKKSGVQSLLRTMNCSHHFYPTAAKKDDGHDATEPEPEYQPEPEPAVQPSPKHTGPVRPIPTNQPGPLRTTWLASESRTNSEHST